MSAMLAYLLASAESAIALGRGVLESLVKVQHPHASAETVPVLESLVSPATPGAERPGHSFASAASARAVSILSLVVGFCLLPFVIVWLSVSQAVHSFTAPSKSFVAARPEAPQPTVAISRPVPESAYSRWSSGELALDQMTLLERIEWQKELEQRFKNAGVSAESPEPQVRTMPKRVVAIQTRRGLARATNGGPSSAPVKKEPVKRRSAFEATAEDIQRHLQRQARGGYKLPATIPAATYEEVHGKPMPARMASRWATAEDIAEAINRADSSGREVGRTIPAATFEEVHGSEPVVVAASAKPVDESVESVASWSVPYPPFCSPVSRSVVESVESVASWSVPCPPPCTPVSRSGSASGLRPVSPGFSLGSGPDPYGFTLGSSGLSIESAPAPAPSGSAPGPGRLFSGPDPDGFTLGSSGLEIDSAPASGSAYGPGLFSGPDPDGFTLGSSGLELVSPPLGPAPGPGLFSGPDPDGFTIGSSGLEIDSAPSPGSSYGPGLFSGPDPDGFTLGPGGLESGFASPDDSDGWTIGSRIGRPSVASGFSTGVGSGPGTNPPGPSFASSFGSGPGTNPPGSSFSSFASGPGTNPPGSSFSSFGSGPGTNPPGSSVFSFASGPGTNPPGSSIVSASDPGTNPPGSSIVSPSDPGTNPPGSSSYGRYPSGSYASHGSRRHNANRWFNRSHPQTPCPPARELPGTADYSAPRFLSPPAAGVNSSDYAPWVDDFESVDDRGTSLLSEVDDAQDILDEEEDQARKRRRHENLPTAQRLAIEAYEENMRQWEARRQAKRMMRAYGGSDTSSDSPPPERDSLAASLISF
ncbi:hypothetical protein MAPG_08218 [Magnaporthiopsis poae ATCC 64411]|uniref:Uncharacterized protein n=1 Tax=Magnaporthiopsis poae (strain ATCC 64411 / 73-15) TaxID=644358 RepID=A0A0C4E6S2_MAGP6|nr:hypothetical protein MAPG_08218 [Magnaporthiopsis poae ATCC 64411]